MSEPVELHGMAFSVYVRIARLALAEKGVHYRLMPLNPFADDPPDPNRLLHPFGKMPVFFHGRMRIIETQAIVRYVDAAFGGPALQPADIRARAVQDQIIGICDNYLYKALVWGVFVEVLRKPVEGGVTDDAAVADALKTVETAFSAIESLLDGGDLTLADLYLGPMLDYGLRVPAAARLAEKHRGLCSLWERLRGRSSFAATEPADFVADLPPHSLG